MTILAIDPGSRCGWAVLTEEGVLCGVVDLARQPDRVDASNRVGGRLNNLSALVESLVVQAGDVTVIACEHPPVMPPKGKGEKRNVFAKANAALHQYHGEVARTADALGLPFDGDIYPGTAKKAATGSGRPHAKGATKAEKAAAVLDGLRRRGIAIDDLTLDDNAIDAIAVALAAEERST